MVPPKRARGYKGRRITLSPSKIHEKDMSKGYQVKIHLMAELSFYAIITKTNFVTTFSIDNQISNYVYR